MQIKMVKNAHKNAEKISKICNKNMQQKYSYLLLLRHFYSFFMMSLFHCSIIWSLMLLEMNALQRSWAKIELGLSNEAWLSICCCGFFPTSWSKRFFLCLADSKCCWRSDLRPCSQKLAQSLQKKAFFCLL